MELNRENMKKIRELILFTAIVIVCLWKFNMVLQVLLKGLNIFIPFLFSCSATLRNIRLCKNAMKSIQFTIHTEYILLHHSPDLTQQKESAIQEFFNLLTWLILIWSDI